MSHEPPLLVSIISLFLAWLPLLLLAGVLLFIYARTGYLRRGAMTHSRYMDECLNEARRQNAVLAALLTKMDVRVSKLEAAARDANKPDA